MALTQTDLDALDHAIASNEVEVEMDGRRVKYKSTSELITARNHVAALVRAAAPQQPRSSFRFRFTTSRGD
ncbi:hypothetical protein [Janthinobacterium sp. 75]|uniref:phage head-tail joining protein n=1 Tax=Janthinobacterium sp. 75 TaxID=2135628 RepID=UPI0010637306|nr:hypothetical protein [Janthinobacterium sp. 75]TDY35096.1 hypothetical protein C8C89_2943 [Janthinobacterium sp. 75]